MFGQIFSRFLSFFRHEKNQKENSGGGGGGEATQNPNMATTTSCTDANDDLKAILSNKQRLELDLAKALESDNNFTFDLHMQEALAAASLALQPSTSTSLPPSSLQFVPYDDDLIFSANYAKDLERLEQELMDAGKLEAELRNMDDDIDRMIHDQKMASDILRKSEVEYWKTKGGNSEDMMSLMAIVSEDVDRLEKDRIDRKISDSRSDDGAIMKIGKPLFLSWTIRHCAEVRALFKRLILFVDYIPNFLYDMCKRKSLKITALVSQVLNLQKKNYFCLATSVVARGAVVSQITGPAESSCDKTPKETCAICLEEKDVGQIFSVDCCLHRYCFSCMKQHVEVKLLHGLVPKCPHEGCKSELKIDSCIKFLTPNLIGIMGQRLVQAFIPAKEKVYCPYPRCLALMSKIGLQEPGRYQGHLRARICRKCSRIFCIECMVPWHKYMTCSMYRMLNPYREAKLRLLAKRNIWRQCVKCKHIIELDQGCYHITCRCGYEFCYNCGAKWENKRATCLCPL